MTLLVSLWFCPWISSTYLTFVTSSNESFKYYRSPPLAKEMRAFTKLSKTVLKVEKGNQDEDNDEANNDTKDENKEGQHDDTKEIRSKQKCT